MKIAAFAFVAMSAFAAMTVNAQQDSMLRSSRSSGTTGTAAGDVVMPLKDAPVHILGVFDAETGNPIGDAEIIDIFTNGVARTILDGPKAGLADLNVFYARNDSVVIRIRKIGYADTAEVAVVDPVNSLLVSVFLRKATTDENVIELPAMFSNGVVGYTGFVGARDFSNLFLSEKNFRGKFFTPDSMRKYDGRQLKDVLKQKSLYPPRMGRCTDPSIVKLDGARVTEKESVLDDPIDRFAAAVYYSGDMAPPDLMAPCGALLLWSRGA